MKAIEFVTHAQDGVIKIPKKYWNALENELRVIILVDEISPEVQQKKAAKRELKAMRIKTKGLIFDRDEANER